jgi:hypothetical protein
MRSKYFHRIKIAMDVIMMVYLSIFCSFFLGYRSDKDIVKDSKVEYAEEYYRSIESNHLVQ